MSTLSNAYDGAFRKWAEKRGFRIRELAFGTHCRACTGFVSQIAVLSPEHTEANEVLCWDCTRSWHDSRPPQGWAMPFFEWLARRSDRTAPSVMAARKRGIAMTMALLKIAPSIPNLWEPEPGANERFAAMIRRVL